MPRLSARMDALRSADKLCLVVSRYTHYNIEPTYMKDRRSQKPSYLLLFLLALINSCSVQDNTSLPKDKVDESNSLAKNVKIQSTWGVVSCAIEDRSGNLWFGTHDEGVYRYDGESFTQFTTKDGLNSNGVSSIVQEKAGDILFGTGNGICRYDGESFIDITQNTALRHSSISALFEDKKGRLWVADYKDGYFKEGDYRGGVYLYEGSSRQGEEENFTNVLSIDSVKNDDEAGLLLINDILEDSAGNIWFAGQNVDGVVYYNGKSLVHYESREEAGLYSNYYRSMTFDKKGNLWLGTHGNGVLSSVPSEDKNGEKLPPAGKGRFINITENAGPGSSVVMSMIEDKNGDMWFCTDGHGVWRYNGRSFKNFTTEDGLVNDGVFSVLEDKEGNLWFGTRSIGLCRYDGKSFTSFSE